MPATGSRSRFPRDSEATARAFLVSSPPTTRTRFDALIDEVATLETYDAVVLGSARKTRVSQVTGPIAGATLACQDRTRCGDW